MSLSGTLDFVMRSVRGLRRPTPAANLRRLRERGESTASFVFRDASAADIPALVRVHVTAWNDTYGVWRGGPTDELRERQWREAFARAVKGHFCIIVARQDGTLVGFAEGQRYSHDDLPQFSGELRKIYLLRDYQRIGLGRRLVGHVARRLLEQGVSSMVLFGTAQNPSSAAWEALGGERLYGPSGEFHGAYGWRDVQRLAETCPID